MIEAVKIAQSIMYAEQHTFEFRDKPSKQLARILSEHPTNYKELPIFKDDGELPINTKEKADIFAKYQKLYRSESKDEGKIASLLNSVDVLKLTDEHRTALDVPISLEEIHQAVAKLRRNSSPGPDGLTTEFYIKFKHSLAVYLHKLPLGRKECQHPGNQQKL